MITEVRRESNGSLPTLASRNGGVVVGFMDVTPELAASWLALANNHNRVINPHWVEKYRRDMEAGVWRSDGMPLRFAGTFELLLDGQHRLAAQVAAGVTITYPVVIGLPDDSQQTMDQGRPRSFADVLKLEGVKGANSVAALVRAVDNYAKTGTPVAQNVAYQPSLAELLDRFHRHPGIAEFALSKRATTGLPSGMTNALRYLTFLADDEDSAVFMHLLETGDRLGIGDPIYTLRERLARDAADKTGAMNAPVKWAFCARTWNAWMRGERLTKLQHKPGGASPDRVQLLDGLRKEDVA